MTIGVLTEPQPETRVALVPELAGNLIQKHTDILIQRSAGKSAFFEDEAYAKIGCKLMDRTEVLKHSTVVLAIHPPESDDLLAMKGGILIGQFQPFNNKDFVQACMDQGITMFSLDMLPRTTRAQAMDVLSSQANIAGYQAVLLAADLYPRCFPMFITAAGTTKPAKILVLGAGVAGLQAIATSRRLGAVVEVFDTRPAVKEEVQSLGAKFIEVEGAADASNAGGYAVEQDKDYQTRQRNKIAEHCAKADIVITTAQIPGRQAPILIDEPMLQSMREGSIIIDLAAVTGGNTPFSVNRETVFKHGVQIIGDSSLPSRVPADSSYLYSKNIVNFLGLMLDNEGKWNINWEDELIKGSCLTHEGKMVNERFSF
ncbi:MAG: Re/Si-specific NAD(P)(+) transhydrogenase subunit alpha [Saprospiraceae bacterium]|nr:Re/Si-specific NAD(P)(+) transhydrogenase subunit alpha [Saprospiraceae bacterium]